MIQKRRIAVVVPAYQEELLIAETLRGIPGFVDRIFVVDDGSTDNTHEIALGCVDSDPRIVVLRQDNQGVGAAIVAGYKAAMRGKCDVIAVMAGDNQMDPVDLRMVCLPVVEGYADYVKGNRLDHAERRKMPSYRRFGTQFLAKATGAIAGIADLNDSQCGYTAISSEALAKLPLERLFPRYGYPNDMLLRLSERSLSVQEVSVRPVYDREVSGLKVHKVVKPISGILVRGLVRRSLGRWL